MKDYAEKRDFTRLVAETEVAFQVIGVGQNHHGLSIDISATGARFETSLLLKPGDKLDFQVSPENTITPPLNAEAEVVRVDNIDGCHGIYIVAVDFLKVK